MRVGLFCQGDYAALVGVYAALVGVLRLLYDVSTGEHPLAEVIMQL